MNEYTSEAYTRQILAAYNLCERELDSKLPTGVDKSSFRWKNSNFSEESIQIHRKLVRDSDSRNWGILYTLKSTQSLRRLMSSHS